METILNQRILKTGFAVALLILLLTALVPFYTAQQVRNLQNEVNQALQRPDILSETISLMKDAETGQRGYVITGEDDFLQPYLAAIQRLPLARQSLRQRFGNDDGDLALESRFEHAIDLKLEELARTIALRRSRGFEAAEPVVADATGKVYMDEIRDLGAQLGDHMRMRITELRKQRDRRLSINAYAGLAVTIPDLVLLSVLMSSLFSLETLRKKADEVLRISTARQTQAEADSIRLAAIVESSRDAIIGKTLEGEITSWNQAAQDMFGYQAAEAIGQSVNILIPPEHEAEEIRILAQLAQGGAVPEFSTIRRAKDGTLLEVSVTVSPIKDAGGNVVGGSKIVRDVSHLRRAEVALNDARKLVEIERAARQSVLEVSLREKEVLLKEVHHRVKNNLQVISSLLQLQAGYLENGETLRVFEESRGRIRSMALVHEMLYQSKDMSRIDFSDYISDLVSALVGSYRAQSARVTIDVQADRVQLDVDRAIPCGLVLNELVSNSLKHGFPDGRSGRVQVHLSGGGDADIVLIVRDDGVGWPETFVPAQSTSLGLQLVHILAKQLSASLHFEGQPGASCTLRLQPR